MSSSNGIGRAEQLCARRDVRSPAEADVIRRAAAELLRPAASSPWHEQAIDRLQADNLSANDREALEDLLPDLVLSTRRSRVVTEALRLTCLYSSPPDPVPMDPELAAELVQAAAGREALSQLVRTELQRVQLETANIRSATTPNELVLAGHRLKSAEARFREASTMLDQAQSRVTELHQRHYEARREAALRAHTRK
jgi:hypothetical protein